ncbi:unnamed protein product [Clonostachys chloroleuca]|uniref:Uncharacterized protein n=1 Tax=Clonostachys chloroleuca TaxID=1926264 RepID=A0AA35VAP5_9HYPO|nr:unnamed protein product [Clonostachys chloroleuca]
MVALKQLSISAILGLGLASRGLAQFLDKAEDLDVRGENVEEIVARDLDLGLEERDEDDELEIRKFEEELLEPRDLDVRQNERAHRPAPKPAPRPRPNARGLE